MLPIEAFFSAYSNRLVNVLAEANWSSVATLAHKLQIGWTEGRRVYLCGNGGSAGNAAHLANDWLYGAGVKHGGGLRVEALTANLAVITCLANDMGYENVFAEQLKVKAQREDLLIVLSGSGDSSNIVKALETGNDIGMETFAILGYSGGRSKEIAKYPIHFEIDDMQIAEDLQLIVGHVCMQWLCHKGKS